MSGEPSVKSQLISNNPKQQQQFASLQKQVQSIASEVHRYHSISRINILSEVKKLGVISGEMNVEAYLNRLEMYHVASTYLKMNMDPNLFVYVTPARRELLSTKRKQLLEAKHHVQGLDIPNEPLYANPLHVKYMQEWYKAMQEVKECQNLNYAFAGMRRMHMKGANTLPIDLANLLNHEVILHYNNERNRIQRVESGFEKQQENIEKLKSQFKLWTTNLHLLFIIMKYTFGISKANNVKKCIQGQGLGDDNKAEFRKRAANFVMNTPDKDLEHLIEQDDDMGLYWVAVPGTHSENTGVFDEKEKFKLKRALETNMEQKRKREETEQHQSTSNTNESDLHNSVTTSSYFGGVGTEIHRRVHGLKNQINLSKDDWKDCGIRIVYPDTCITVGEVPFKPFINKDTAIYELAMREEMTSSAQTKEFIMYCRGLNPSFPNYYADKPRNLRV